LVFIFGIVYLFFIAAADRARSNLGDAFARPTLK
jgi:hypothetical protein